MDFGSINFGGLASGIDTKALIDAILDVERQPLRRIEARQSQLGQQKSAMDEMRSKLNAFLSTLRDISSDRTFNARVATVSDETALAVSSGIGADTGLFAVEINQLATAEKIASNGVSAPDEGLVSDGTITIQSGTLEAITIDVSSASANNTLEEVRDAINDADKGVRASVLFDGTDYRLIVRAEETGLENALTVTDSTNLGLDDPVNEVTAAADAQIVVDGISVTSASNSVSNVISGVTLELLTTTATTPVNVNVANDVEGAVAGVKQLVEDYNEAAQFFNSQLDLSNPGPLAGDSYTRRLQQTLASLVTAGAEGIPFGEIRSLSSLGVSFDGRSGELKVDTAKLTGILDEQFEEVGRLFLSSKDATDSRIRFLSTPADAASGEYAVAITQAAEQASLVGDEAIRLAGLRRDETLTITLDGEITTIDLFEDQVIDEVVDTVNAGLAAAGLAVTASNDAGALRIEADEFGSSSLTVESSRNSNNGRQTGFGTSPVTDVGADVAGTIGGLAATGAGQVLTALDGGELEGLSLLVTATPTDVIATGGDFGTVSFSTGLTQPLIDDLADATRVGDGRIESAQEILDDQVKALADEILRLEERLVGREARLIQTFTAAEQAIAALQSQQSQLGSFFPF